MNAKPSFFAELRRRNVLRAAALYIAGAWALAQGLAQLLPVFGAPDWLTRWFVIACIIGFPFWVAFAWFYEFTPTGLKREDEIVPGDSIAHLTKRKLDFWIIGVLAVSVVLLVTNQLVQRPDTHANGAATVRAAPIPAKSVAVLPLTNESGNPQQDYFSDGLSEELIANLTEIDDLKVIGKRSSFEFRGSRDSPAVIGRKLGVATLLEGSVYQQGNHVRITIALIRASDGSNLWAHTYDRELKDIFAVQSDISHAVGTALEITFQGKLVVTSDQPPSGDVKAYELMLQGRAVERRATSDADYRQSIALLRQAISRDPNYAYTWALLSTTFGLLSNQLDGDARRTAQAQARSAADRAQVLAPNAVATHRARAFLLANLDYDLMGALAEYQKASALAPRDATMTALLANALASVGKLSAATTLYEKAIVTEPVRPDFFVNLAVALLGQGRLDDAEKATRKALQMQRDYPGLYTMLSMIEVVRGNASAALRYAKQETDAVDKIWMLAAVAQISPDKKQADASMENYVAKHQETEPYAIADLYALRAQPDQMFEWLNRAWAQHDPNFTQLLYDPFPLAYRHDPRFAALRKQAGLPPPEQILPATASSSRL